MYRMVRPFKDFLTHFIYAKSGKKVRAFLDQEDIAWGDIWMDRLETEILNASVFIPLLSASYLDSENCRLEFNRFQTNASSLGVSELLLPVLLLDAPAVFNSYSSDDIVQEASARQWEVIEDAILSDPGSAAWKTTMARVADRFVLSYGAAESKLAQLTNADLNAASIVHEVSEEGLADPEDDGPGLAELAESIQASMEQLNEDARALQPAIEGLGAAAKNASSLQQAKTPQQLQAWSRDAAHEFAEPASQLSRAGENMLSHTKALDVDMQRLRRLALEILPQSETLAHSYNEMAGQLTGLGSVRDQLEDLLSKMKPAEAISVPLRRALHPAQIGLTRVTDSLKLMESWKSIDTA